MKIILFVIIPNTPVIVVAVELQIGTTTEAIIATEVNMIPVLAITSEIHDTIASM